MTAWADRAVQEKRSGRVDSTGGRARPIGWRSRSRSIALATERAVVQRSESRAAARSVARLRARVHSTRRTDAATTAHLVSSLSPVYPSGDRDLDRELCQVLLDLGAPGAVSKSVGRLLAATTQAEEMFYAYHLRTIREGWTLDDRRAYFGWLGATEREQGDYVGGNHFSNFLKMVRREAVKSLSAEESTALASVLEQKTAPPRVP